MIQISMGGGGQIRFFRKAPHSLEGTSYDKYAVTTAAAAEDEVYEFAMPSLILHAPLSHKCRLDWKGPSVLAETLSRGEWRSVTDGVFIMMGINCRGDQYVCA